MSRTRIDLTGRRFGRLVVSDQWRPRITGSKHIEWLCKCDCGNQTWLPSDRIQSGKTASCGCIRKEIAAEKGRSTRKPIINGQRKCATCTLFKPVSEFSPRPARNGYHSSCKTCVAAKVGAYRAADPERARESSRRSVANFRERNPEGDKAIAQRYRNTHLESVKSRIRDWQRANPGVMRAHNTLRKTLVKQATPAWVDRAGLIDIYVACPADHHVDHIVPIRGKTADGYRISGLHVPWNLQYLPTVANLTKHNRMRPHEQAMCEGVAIDRSQQQLTLAL